MYDALDPHTHEQKGAITRAQRFLRYNNFDKRTLGELLARTERELLNVPNFGKKSLVILQGILNSDDLEIEMLQFLNSKIPEPYTLQENQRWPEFDEEKANKQIPVLRESQHEILRLLGSDNLALQISSIFTEEEAASVGLSLTELHTLAADPDFKARLLRTIADFKKETVSETLAPDNLS